MIWLILFSAFSWSAQVSCPHHLTQLGARRAGAAESTQQLNKIYFLAIEQMIRQADGLDHETFLNLSARARANIVDTKVYDRTYPSVYDGAYPARFEVLDSSLYGNMDRPLKAPYTRYSRVIMNKLMLALTILHYAIQSDHTDLASIFLEHKDFLNERSYAGSRLLTAIYFAHQTILSAVAQLLSGAVDRLGASHLLKRVMLRQNGRASLVVQLALALPPRELGRHGEIFFIRRSLTPSRSGELIFSPRMRNYLQGRRAYFADHGKMAYEFGQGCPVAHTLPGCAESGLQMYLDLVLRLIHLL